MIALAACRTADGRALYPDTDGGLLRQALAERGIDGVTVAWDDAGADWAAYDLVVVRGTWDSVDRPAEFLAWVDAVSEVTRIEIPAPALAWNLDKRYLVDLERAGLPIVPTTWVRPGDPWAPSPGPFVVKPAISGGGRETARYHRRVDEAVAHVVRLQRQGRTAMVQPYVPSVDEPSETKMVVVDGRFSHAVRVGPLLDADGGVLDVPWEKPVAIAAVEPSGAEVELADAVVAQASERCGPSSLRPGGRGLGGGGPAGADGARAGRSVAVVGERSAGRTEAGGRHRWSGRRAGAGMKEDRGVVAWTAGQYRDDRNLRARQRLWEQQVPRFDLAGWVLGLGEVAAGQRVLDLGCGNGVYLRALRERGIEAVGCDLSPGMLRAVGQHPALVNADATRLPFVDGAFDVVLAPHMLYHVPDQAAAAAEMRRTLRPGGVAVVVTNGGGHMRELREIVEGAARASTPGWEMANPSTHVFSLESGADDLSTAFDDVVCVRPTDVAAVALDDADIAADYTSSVGDHYEHEVAVPWSEVVAEVRRRVQAVIDAEGVFRVTADTGAFVCR